MSYVLSLILLFAAVPAASADTAPALSSAEGSVRAAARARQAALFAGVRGEASRASSLEPVSDVPRRREFLAERLRTEAAFEASTASRAALSAIVGRVSETIR